MSERKDWSGPLSEPEFRSLTIATRSVVGCELPPDGCRAFLEFHRYITADPLPAFIAESKRDPAAKRWVDRLTNGILGATQNALACVYYHHSRIVGMERQVVNVIHDAGVIERLQATNSLISPGNTIALDAEYQAFILSARRCLDYFARAIAAFFRADFHSFRKLGSFLSSREPMTVSKTLKAEHQTYIAKFSRSLLSRGEAKSTRDLISHYEYISAGVLNITPRGVFFAGGGEQIGWKEIREGKTLGTLVTEQKHLLQACIDNLLRTFIISSQHHFSRVMTANRSDAAPESAQGTDIAP